MFNNGGMGKAYTTDEQIREVRRAIREAQQGAKSATVTSPAGQRSYTRHDLPVLYAREKELLSRRNRANIRKRVLPDFGDTAGTGSERDY